MVYYSTCINNEIHICSEKLDHLKKKKYKCILKANTIRT